MSGLRSVDGDVVLITGAAGALGAAASRLLAGAGARVALVDRDEDALNALAAELPGSMPLVCDMLDDEAVRALSARAESELGPVAGLVSCAGVEFNQRFHTASWADLDRQLGIHLRAPMMLIHAVLPGMVDRGRGQVVVVSSMNGKLPFPAKVPYSAAKAGSIAMTHALRREYEGSGVGFSLVLPTLVVGAGQAARAMQSADVSPPESAATCTVDECAVALHDAVHNGGAEFVVSSRPVATISGLQWSDPPLADVLLMLSGMPKFWMDLAG
jgi:short-subunit dehydrogenase